MSSTGSVFENNRTQSVRLPAEIRFPSDVKRVVVRVIGQDRVLSPVERSWGQLFLSDEQASDNFLVERASQE